MNKPLVLVVDDDQEHVELIREILEAHGYRVATARAGEVEAVAQREQPALILLDILMPGVNGIVASRHLRADPATAAIPIVIVSSSANLVAGSSLAVDGLLRKPFHVAELLAMVARWAPVV